MTHSFEVITDLVVQLSQFVVEVTVSSPVVVHFTSMKGVDLREDMVSNRRLKDLEFVGTRGCRFPGFVP